MSQRTRKRNAKEKSIRRHSAEVIRLEGVIERYEEKIPKLKDRLEDQKRLLKAAEDA